MKRDGKNINAHITVLGTEPFDWSLRIHHLRTSPLPSESKILSVFIFIFFLLMSASFLKIYEIGSDVPIVSDAEPPKEQKDPLALTMTIDTNEITLSTGVPSRLYKKFTRQPNEDFNYDEIHTVLIDLKKCQPGRLLCLDLLNMACLSLAARTGGSTRADSIE